MKNFNRDELIGVDEKSAVELWPRNSSNLNIYAARHEVGAGMAMTVVVAMMVNRNKSSFIKVPHLPFTIHIHKYLYIAQEATERRNYK